VLGGGIMEEEYIIRALQEKIGNYIMPSFADVVIAKAALGNDAGLWGAGYLALTKPLTFD
jgi:predicted NBD/HSP70 family sugar kinase